MRIIPEHFPAHIKQALAVFSTDELDSLVAGFGFEDGSFIGIGFFGPGGKFCKFANPEKAKAVGVLEEQYRDEMAGTQEMTKAESDGIISGEVNDE